jgi:hypothetical protein
MIGWAAEHMELTDGDGQINRLRYRWNRVRWANPNGHLAKAEPGDRLAALGQVSRSVPVTCAIADG